MSRSRSRKPGLIISNNKTSLFLEIFNDSNLNAFQFTANSENILLFLSSKHTVCIQLMTLPYWPDGDGGMDHKDTIDNVDGMIIVLWLRKKVAINPRVLFLRHDVWIISVDTPLFPVWTADTAPAWEWFCPRWTVSHVSISPSIRHYYIKLSGN